MPVRLHRRLPHADLRQARLPEVRLQQVLLQALHDAAPACRAQYSIHQVLTYTLRRLQTPIRRRPDAQFGPPLLQAYQCRANPTLGLHVRHVGHKHALENASRYESTVLQQTGVAGCTWLHFSAVHRNLLGAQLAQLWSQADILQSQPSTCSGMPMALCVRRLPGQSCSWQAWTDGPACSLAGDVRRSKRNTNSQGPQHPTCACMMVRCSSSLRQSADKCAVCCRRHSCTRPSPAEMGKLALKLWTLSHR